MPFTNPDHPEWGTGYYPREVAAMMYRKGWIDVVKLHLGVWVLLLESNLYSSRVHVNDDGSRDRGIAMLNDAAHPDVSDEEAFDVNFSLAKMRQMYIDAGNTFSPWAAMSRINTVIQHGPSGDAGAVKMCLYACDAVGANMIKEKYGLLA